MKLATLWRWPKRLSIMSKCLMWHIGDWLLVGETAEYIQRGKLDKACQRWGIAYETAANALMVCKAIKSSLRSEDLCFKHHQEVANRPLFSH